MDVILWNALDWGNILSRTIGPYKLAHWLRKHGHSTQVIEFTHFLTEKQLLRATRHFITPETKIIGISTTFFQWALVKHQDGLSRRMPESIWNVIRRIKLEYPYIKIVLGGYQSESYASHSVFDAAVMSYTQATEDVMLEYLEYLKGLGPEPQHQVMLHRSGQYLKWYNQPSNPTYNIETDDFMFARQDCILPGEPLPLDVSRGCIFTCKFCQYAHLGKKKYDYVRGMQFLEQELLHNYATFGTTSYYILDDTFNDTPQKLQDFHAMTRRLPFSISFSAYLRADLINRFPETADLLQESGLLGAFLGIETLHPDASRIIGKAWSGRHAREFVPRLYHDIWKKQVIVHTNFIVGITHDTEANVIDTARWFVANDLHSAKFEFLGLWGGAKNFRFQIKSEFDLNAEKYGYSLEYKDSTGIPDWKNNNWTKASAQSVADAANRLVDPWNRAHPWKALPYRWLNASREDLLRRPEHEILAQTFGNNQTIGSLLQQYLDLLLR